MNAFKHLAFVSVLSLVLCSCGENSAGPSEELIKTMNLKRGDIIFCGASGGQYGSVTFETSCNGKVKEDFNLAVKLLHSFEYDEAEKVFAKIIDAQPGCAMAYWGVAMSNFHPLWTPPTEPELVKGAKAVELAQSVKDKSPKEADYIEGIAAFYKDWNTVPHRTRCISFEKAMENLYVKYPEDKEAAIFYALALNAAADPADKTFQKQIKAGTILNALYTKEPNHPGVVHYIIHTYDSPELADSGLQAAKRYASVAPSSAHALHMPSHIFTRLGLWNECIGSNLASLNAAQCYAQSAGIKGHWDEELHAMDYLVYGYLQRGDNNLAKKQLDSLQLINEVHPVNFKVVYAFAAIPARYALENKNWAAAANLPVQRENVSWETYPWQKAIIHFARLMGAVHTGKIDSAKVELLTLHQIYNKLVALQDPYKANQVAIQIKAGEAWLRFGEKKYDEAVTLMNAAAEMEDKTEKHPVTPGEVLPARELVADLLLQLNKPAEALKAYEEDLRKHPNRFNGLYGAGIAAEKSGDAKKAAIYYRQLLSVADSASNRPELNTAKQFLAKQ